MEDEELIHLLKKSKKMSYKYLAKRIQKCDNNNVKEQERIYAKVYELFISLLSDESIDHLMKIEATIQLIVKRICDDSGWQFLDDSSFSLESARVSRDESGYITTSNCHSFCYKKEFSFIAKYDILLNILHDQLLDKELLFQNEYLLKDDNNTLLAQKLLIYLGQHSRNDKIKQKILNRK